MDIIPRPEHPRPDMERTEWLNLNGIWQFEIDERGDGHGRKLMSGHDLKSKINVPFCPESALSGIGNTGFMHHVWYRRHLVVPGSMIGKRLRLHFGAADWHTKVWLNGKSVGEHRGGYTSFWFEITDMVTDGENELVVYCYDDTRSPMQASGKQCHETTSVGCAYTRTTGIWQTVWLEAVGKTYLRDLALTPDLDGGKLRFGAWIDGPQDDVKLRVRVYHGKEPVGETTVQAAWRSTTGDVELAKITSWSPGNPFLYNLQVEVIRAGKVIDSLKSYFGLRKITVEGNKVLINDKPIFQRLVLDQGFYPDGIYTAATDEALRNDIELSMQAGFNGARLHQKVFEPRFLYWADKLGYLVWGEYPNWGIDLNMAESLTCLVEEWNEVLLRDRNHPSIIGWCPLNETDSSDGVARAQRLLTFTRYMDPTRPYLDTSGWAHFDIESDIYDVHDYDQNPHTMRDRYAGFAETGEDPYKNHPVDPRNEYRGQPYFVSEYGGIRLAEGESDPASWGYGSTDMAGYIERYRGLTHALLDNPNMFAFCYTQLTDVEQEQNGIYTYERKVKADPAVLAEINKHIAAIELA